MATTAQNAGADGKWNTPDDLKAPLNADEVWVSNDPHEDDQARDLDDRIRNFASVHPGGANFSFADGSLHFLTEDIDDRVYHALGTRNGGETPESHAF